MKESESCSRKRFLKTAGSTVLFAALGIGYSGCSSTTTGGMDQTENPPDDSEREAVTVSDNGNTVVLNLSAENLAGLRQAGGWMLIREAETLVVNVDGETLRAFTSVCTHTGCSTNWEFSGRLFQCNCHGSRFDTGGNVVRGPAADDLEEYTVERDDTIVTIKK